MANTVFGRLFYLNNYNYCSNNAYLNEMLPIYIDYCLYSDVDSYEAYLTSLKEEYNHHNYMFILENIINYIIKIFNFTFQDYMNNNRDKNIEVVLNNLMKRYNSLLKLYNMELNNHLEKTDNINNNQVHYYRQTKFKKRKVYTIMGK